MLTTTTLLMVPYFLTVFSGYAQSAPEDVRLTPNLQEETLLVQFLSVPNASYYIIEVPELTASFESRETALLIPGIQMNTNYTIKISSENHDGSVEKLGEYKLQTGKIILETISATDIHETQVSLQWNAVPGSIKYYMNVTNENGVLIQRMSTEETKATITHLEPLSKYLFSISTQDGVVDNTKEITVKTDGDEVKIENEWFIELDSIKVVQGLVHRSKSAEDDDVLNLTFNCPVSNFEVWNGALSGQSSDSKTVSIIQNQTWMATKQIIGFRFRYDKNSCDFDPDNVELEVIRLEESTSGSGEVEEEVENLLDIPIDIPTEVFQWTGGGMIKLDMKETLQLEQLKIGKSQVAFRLDGSFNCTSVMVNYCWNIHMVNESISSTNTLPLPMYFVQGTETSWFDNQPGIVFEFDEECIEPSDLRITALIGGSISTNSHEKYFQQEHNNSKCT